MTNITADVVIIGGGIHGCSSALQLAKEGLKVVVVERHYPGRHASGVNAGGVRQLGRDMAEVPLSVASMAMWHEIEELLGDDCGFEHAGQIQVAENEDELQLLKQRVVEMEAAGFDHEVLIDIDHLRELTPAISSHCCGAILSAKDGHAKPFRTTQAFHRAAKAHGVEFVFGRSVTEVKQCADTWHVIAEDHYIQAATLVNAAGSWGNKIAAQLGEDVPVEPTALMLMITERVTPFVKPVVGAIGRTLSFKQFSNGTVLVGGGLKGKVDIERFKAYPDLKGLMTNAETATDIFPLMKNVRVVRSWAGIEGFMPDGIPVIGASKTHSSAFHLFGFSAHGFQLGPITGTIIRDLVLGKSSKLTLEPFSVDRFNA
jgi:sarcosine oxidase subunit beta